MKHLDLFSGIGGFALAVDAVWPATEHIFCEIDPFCQTVLKKHWPGSTIYGDIKNFHPKYPVDLVIGGFPCQPFSHAGKRKGKDDDRYLWSEMLLVIKTVKPSWIVGENVAGIITLALDQVLSDLETEGYRIATFVIPAYAVNAPHQRERVWIIGHADRDHESDGSEHEEVEELPIFTGRAYTDTERHSVQGRKIERKEGEEMIGNEQLAGFQQFSIGTALSAARAYRKHHGVSPRLDVRRNKALGNAIVPQVAEQIFRAIALSYSSMKF